MEKTVSLEKRRALIDLIIIVAVTMTVLGAFIMIQGAVEGLRAIGESISCCARR